MGTQRRHRVLYITALLIFNAGCAELAYYTQSALGQLEILRNSQDVEAVLASDQLAITQRQRLETVQAVRQFAASELGMSFNASYTRYVDLERDYVLKNLVAAPEFSTTLHQWCYPLIGCASYRGFFNLDQLDRLRLEFERDRFDTYVYEVTAYSTLGWFKDPVMRSFLDLSRNQLVELILHELAHQQLYVNGDSRFNESFATAVARAGSQRFFGTDRIDDTDKSKTQGLSNTINAIAAETKTRLDTLYAGPLRKEEKRQRKRAIFDAMQRDYRQLADASPGIDLGFLHEKPLNNARLGLMNTYTLYVPGFLNVLEHNQGDFTRFFQQSKRLGSLDASKRSQCMQAWSTRESPGETPGGNCL